MWHRSETTSLLACLERRRPSACSQARPANGGAFRARMHAATDMRAARPLKRRKLRARARQMALQARQASAALGDRAARSQSLSVAIASFSCSSALITVWWQGARGLCCDRNKQVKSYWPRFQMLQFYGHTEVGQGKVPANSAVIMVERKPPRRSVDTARKCSLNARRGWCSFSEKIM